MTAMALDRIGSSVSSIEPVLLLIKDVLNTSKMIKAGGGVKSIVHFAMLATDKSATSSSSLTMEEVLQ
jgi:hypothetical protein